MADKETDKSQDGGTKERTITIKVDGEDKVLTAEGAQNLQDQQASATRKSQDASTAFDLAEKYGLTVEELMSNAEGAFGAVSTLMEDGVIDNKGKLIEKKSETLKVEPKEKVGEKIEKKDEVITTLEATVLGLKKQVEMMDKSQTSLMRTQLHERIKGKHSGLSDNDIGNLFTTAMNDQKKDIWQHAEEMVTLKEETRSRTRAEIAEELGVDLKKFDANKIAEQEGGGGAAAILGGKIPSFKAKSGDEGKVSPGDAAQAYLEKVHQEINNG